MKENLAAAILIRANWPALSKEGLALLDPMCGSGTLLIEAAMIACQKAPALDREYFGFSQWKSHDAETWSKLVAEARARFSLGLTRCRAKIVGSDIDGRVLTQARRNIKRAGFANLIEVSSCALEKLNLSDMPEKGLLISNPPYGERLGDIESLKPLYAALGDKMKRYLQGWNAAIFTSNPDLCKQMAIRSHKQYKLFNGALPAQLLLFTLTEDNFQKRSDDFTTEAKIRWCEEKFADSERAAMFANRLRKNNKRLQKWAKKSGVSCYRIYDADMPEFALAIDRYEDWVHIQEYQAPASIDHNQAKQRLNEALSQVCQVLAVAPEKVVLKQRRRQKGKDQYEKQDNRRNRIVVNEHGCRFYVNLTDYLDTGLFLDHRPVRQWIQGQAKNKSFLNLFCYTGTASVHAAVGGAKKTTSVDMSNTYIQWAKDNFHLNQLRGDHQFVQQDCIAWLKASTEKFDMIFLDPPTFSNSKRMSDTLDIQRDHVELINQVMKLLTFDGVLVFSNNLRKFKLDEQALSAYQIENISDQTIGEDFARNRRIHQCWTIKHQWQADW